MAAPLVVFVGFGANASAVCLDPGDPTGTSYHYPSLEEEATGSAAIVVVRVVRTEPLGDNSSDPEGWSAFNYTLQVIQVFKGEVSRSFGLRVENDSGGYRMWDGETHLLFLANGGVGLRVDPCGNSTEMPQGAGIVKRLRAILQSQQHVG